MSDRGEFALRPGVGPRIHRKVAGHIEEISLRGRLLEDSEDAYLRGLTREDTSSGRQTGFSRQGFTEKIIREAAAGSGPDVDGDQYAGHRPERSDNYEQTGYSAPTDQGHNISEDVGESDLMGQPRTKPRVEYMDPVAPRSEDAGYERRKDNIDLRERDGDPDIWEMDLFNEFDGYSDGVPHETSGPTFSGQPHRQQEASRRTPPVDELDNIFADVGETFSKRGL